MLDFDSFEVLTFDCYGTLVDWETGILRALQPLLNEHQIAKADDAILQDYARLESAAESGEYRSYREVLREVVDGFGRECGFEPTDDERRCLEQSVPSWEPFEDTVRALEDLHTRYRLAVFSNIDEDLFDHTAPKLGVKFDHLVTAQQVRAYKPAPEFFREAVEEVGAAKSAILHVAQSLHHDIAPARRFGLSTVWVNRRHARDGSGATPPGRAKPDLVVPDLRTLVNGIAL